MITIIDKQSELKLLAKSIFSGLATVEDFAHFDVDEVVAIKSDTSEPRRLYSVIEKAEPGKGARVKRFIASTERADRGGDIVRVSGWDFKDFKKNPMAVWCHQTRELPLGLVQDIEKDSKGTPPTLFESINFHDAELSPFADQVYRYVDSGAIRAVSVSFIPLPGGVRYPNSPEERDQMGLGLGGVEYVKHSQIELSVCVVPMQADALATKSMLDKAVADMVRSKQISEAQAKELLAATEGPKVFAVSAMGGVMSEPRGDTDPAKTPPTEGAVERVLSTLEKTLTTLNQSIDNRESQDARIKALEDELAELREQNKANGAPQAPVQQGPTATPSRAHAGADFYTKAFEKLDAERN